MKNKGQPREDAKQISAKKQGGATNVSNRQLKFTDFDHTDLERRS